jgi:hypothetical protein
VLDKWIYFGINKGFVHRPEYTASGIQTALLIGMKKAKEREHLARQKTQTDCKLYTLFNKISLQNHSCYSDNVRRECKENCVVEVLQF